MRAIPATSTHPNIAAMVMRTTDLTRTYEVGTVELDALRWLTIFDGSCTTLGRGTVGSKVLRTTPARSSPARASAPQHCSRFAPSCKSTIVHLYSYTFIHIFMHTFTHICTFIQLYIDTYIHSHIHSFIHLYIYTFVC